MPRFQDIPQLTKSPPYAVDVGWDYLEEHIKGQSDKRCALDLEPDFQRAHVWTEAQQSAYVEYILRGGTSGRDLYFNCKGWMNSYSGPYVIVDGKQRLQAVRRFLRDEIPAFGAKRSEYTDRMRISGPSFKWHVNDLKTRAQVLTWYLEFNSGGTPHTEAELDKVRQMLENERPRCPNGHPLVHVDGVCVDCEALNMALVRSK